jgi:ATP-dependent DNA helicase DinG
VYFLTEYKYVVIDIETTGNRINDGDQVIQIGMCTINKGEIGERFSSFVKPTIPIPPFIERLTGISDQVVEEAPSIEEILPDVVKRLEDSILVAHNVHFDLRVLQNALQEHGYPPYSGMIIDTVELSRILLPNRVSYKLHQLANDLNMQHDHPHQADSDALATAQLFQILCSKLWQLPLVTIQRMIPIARTLFSDVEHFFRKVEQARLQTTSNKNDTLPQTEVYRHLALALPDTNTMQPIGEISQPNRNSSGFDVKAIIQSVMTDYEVRPEQDELAHEIFQSFLEEKHGIFEAATGTGKTLAYLIAALYWSKLYGKKVVISTHTIQLQGQIQEKEIPRLVDALPFSFEVSLLKGRNHYLCLRKFEQSLFKLEDRNYDSDLTKLQLLVWLTETKTGDIEELNVPSGGKDYWQKVQSETPTCLHHKCPWFKRCYYFRAKDMANEADLVITNHALLMADLKGSRILPEYEYLVIDEAHHLEQVATEQYGKSVHYSAIHFVIQRLSAMDKPNISDQLIQALDLSENGHHLIQKVDEILFLLSELKIEIDQLFTGLANLAEQKQSSMTEEKHKSIRIVHQKESGEPWVSIIQLMGKISNEFTAISVLYYRFMQLTDSIQEDLSHTGRSSLIDWSSSMKQLEEYVLQIDKMLLNSEQGYVYWIEYESKGARNSSAMFQMPLQVGKFLEEELFLLKKSVALTSATLQVKESFQYVIDQLGIPIDSLRTKIIHSPFDYESQATLLISNDISHIHDVNEGIFTQEIAKSIIELISVSQGRTMILFTSYQMLRSTYQLLKQPLQEQGVILFAQGIDSGSRGKLTRNFQSQNKAVLLGTSSFWEGVDIPGEQLSCLVIVKLPFTPPNTPYFQAKAEELKASGKNPFMDYALPQAVIRFKQGFGRLIRKATDRGVVVVFDRRIIEARYGKLFIQSLPKVRVQSVDREQLVQEIQRWLG